MGNKIADQLAKEGPTCNKLNPAPRTHFAHTIPYWRNGVATGDHKAEIHNLQTDLNKSHREQELIITRKKEKNVICVEKWVSNEP